jgi:TolB-like protein/Tfp pilus assembly protein PilF
MHDFLSKLQRLLADFRRRRVFRVAAVYAVVAFVLLEVMDALFPALLLPDWADTLVAVLLIVGFPVAVILAWAYDITPEGVKRTPAEGGSAPTLDRADASPVDTRARRAAESIAVLPFVNLSGEPESEYLSDGITEELINALNQIDGLRVASRGTCFRFKGKTADAREVGAELGVDAILEGSVRKSGDRLRINVQLANAGDGFDIWSGSYDRQLTDIFELQDEISRSILDALCCELPGGEGAALIEAPTADVTAYEYYLRGRQFFHERRKKSLRFAREMFEKAIEIDPDYALAHAGVADSCSLLAHWYQDAREEANIGVADRASQRAIELAPDLGQAHASRGFALYLMGQLEEAQSEFETAIRLDPKQFDARYFQARACYEQGDMEGAARLFEEAAAAREDHEARYFAAQTYTALDNAEEAEAAYRRALPVIERHLELNPNDARAWTMGAVTHSRLSNRELGLEFAERAEEVDPEDAAVCYNVACLYALEGEADRAIACLEKAARSGFAHPEWIRQDPDLDSLRDDPRLQALLDGI